MVHNIHKKKTSSLYFKIAQLKINCHYNNIGESVLMYACIHVRRTLSSTYIVRVYKYMSIFAYIYIYIYVYIYIYIYIYVCMCIYVCVCGYVCMCVYVCVYMCVCLCM